ncbi:hypothetical protein CNY89_08370, partial [Amaricoccus sp. HAR-UPW-R2A-40]
MRRRFDRPDRPPQVDEGAWARLGEHPGLGAGDLAVELRNDAERQVACLEPVLEHLAARSASQEKILSPTMTWLFERTQ